MALFPYEIVNSIVDQSLTMRWASRVHGDSGDGAPKVLAASQQLKLETLVARLGVERLTVIGGRARNSTKAPEIFPQHFISTPCSPLLHKYFSFSSSSENLTNCLLYFHICIVTPLKLY